MIAELKHIFYDLRKGKIIAEKYWKNPQMAKIMNAFIELKEHQKELYFKYIESAVKVNQLKEVERVVRDKKECYDPVRVKDFLKQIKLADPIPLLVLCD